MRRTLYRIAVRKANKFANRTEGYYTFSIWDDLAAFLWKPGFEE